MARLDMLAIQDPPTPIISNQSPQKLEAIETLDLNGGPVIPMIAFTNGSSTSTAMHRQSCFNDTNNGSSKPPDTNNGSSKPPVTPRFSSPTEEPIILQRSSLTPMNGFRPEHPSQALSTQTRSSISDSAALSHSMKWNVLYWMFSDLLRSGLSFQCVQHNIRPWLSLDALIFHSRNPSLAWDVGCSSYSTTHDSAQSTTLTLSQRRRRRLYQQGLPRQIVGLPNQGQTCFLNSVLQSLASLPPFLAYLDGIVQCQEDMAQAGIALQSDATHEEDGCSSSPSFSHQLLDLLDGINSLKDHDEEGMERKDYHGLYNQCSPQQRWRQPTLNPKPLLRLIGESTNQFKSRPFSSMEQQDAQELLIAMLSVVIEDAQLDALLDRRFVETEKLVPAGDVEGNSTQMALSQIAKHNEQIVEDDLFTSAMANSCLIEGEIDGDIESVESSAGLALEGDTSNLLSLSGFLQRIEDEHHKTAAQTIGDSLDAISVVRPPVCVQQERDHDRRHFQEEKKQEHNDDCTAVHRNTFGPTFPTASQQLRKSNSAASMRSAISSVTPSPLSGWLGSTVQCTKCKHVRPIQNSPFLEIPLVPTSVPSYIERAYHAPSQPPAPNTPSTPPCSLSECLADFTSVERVRDVECRFCTILREINHFEEEASFLRAAVETMEKKLHIKATNGNNGRNENGQFDHTKHLRDDLFKVEQRLLQLRNTDPDVDDDSSAPEQPGVEENFEQMLTVEDTYNVKIERCEARKCLLLTRTPSVLCCHVQRRYFDPYTNRMEKCIQHVDFPEVLDVSPYCAYGPRARTPWAAGSTVNSSNSGIGRHPNGMEKGKGQMLYKLRSIIEHRGNAYGGHYVCYRKDHSGRWYLISDSAVTLVSWRDVCRAQAYLLFYEAM